MNKYAFRAIESKWQAGIDLLVLMGVLAKDEDGLVIATDGGCWRGPEVVQVNRKPTGMIDEDGNEIFGPVTDEQGNKYNHANLDTPHDIAAIAAELSEVPELAAAMADLSSWFILDEEGKPRLPKNPVEVIF